MLVNFAFYHALARGMSAFLSTTIANNKIKIYKGTMPTDANDWNKDGYGSPADEDLLVTFSNFKIDAANTQNVANDVQSVIFVTAGKPSPNPVNATATGTAAWYAMYDDAAFDGVLIGEVSATGGTGTLRLDSVSLTSGNPVTITHFGLRFGP
jgi:hypothetical protein